MSLIHWNFIKEVGVGKFIVRTIHRQFYKRILRRSQRMRLPTGELFQLPRTSQFATEAFITNGDVDWGSEALLFRLASRARAFMDIGANIGYYSQYMRPGVSAVYAFEPDPRMFALLRDSLAGHANVMIFPLAVGSRNGKARFTLEKSGEVSHFAHHPSESDPATVVVDTVTVDSFVERQQIHVGIIKTDVEGFDLDVLRGAQMTLQTQRPIVLSEIQPSAELFTLVHGLGYCICAYLRDIQSRKKSFCFIDGPLRSDQAAKMLFLIPAERIAEVSELAASLRA
jgi:FkbM family methyltransferase